MTRIRLISLSLLLLAGCGALYYIPEHGATPATLTVSAYTQQGCVHALQDEAAARGVRATLRDVQSDLGWEIILWPMYKGYRCTGVVQPLDR